MVDKPTEEQSEKTEEKAQIGRRSYLGMLGAGVGSVATLSGTSKATSQRVDIVAAGADNTGNRLINDVLEQVHGDGVEVYFPPGTYRLDPIHLRGTNWSLVGDDATLVVPANVNSSRVQTYPSEWLFFEGSNWTVEGFTIDLTANGAAPSNWLQGADWEFRDVEFVGQVDDPDYRGKSFLLMPAVERNASGLIENVVAVDGCADPDGSSNWGLSWFGDSVGDRSVYGELTWRGCHFSQWANNTIYSGAESAPITIEDCVFENTNVGVRIVGNTTVRNCIWKQSGSVPAQRWTGGRAARGLWIATNSSSKGEIAVEDCQFDMTGPDATSAIESNNDLGDITISGCRIEQANGDPAISLDGGGSTTIQSTSITGTSRGDAIYFRNRDNSSLSGICIEQAGDGIVIEDSSDVDVSGSTVNVDGYPLQFPGSDVSTSDVSYSGSCPVPDLTLDDGSNDESGSGSDDGSDDGSSDGDVLTITGTGTATEYEFTVDGTLRANDSEGALESWDTIDDTTASGWVTSESQSDSFLFTGDVTAFTFIQGEADIALNGQSVTADELLQEGSSSDDDVLTITGMGTATEYEFTAGDTLKPNDSEGALESWDTIDGTTAVGWVTNESQADSFLFTGGITDFTFLQGEAALTLNGQPITVDELLGDETHVLTITGTGTATEYEFTVDGSLEENASEGKLESWDTIDGTSAVGWVTNESQVDSFLFTGDVTEFTFTQGDAAVTIDGESVDPSTLG